ncbi:MAG: hypothetical protein RLN75_04800 [Longimicrobiales bacterium]
MAKTGESYTTARAHLLAPSTDPPAGPDPAALAGMSDEAVARRTGRTWTEWTAWLDARSAAELPHPDIARLVATAAGGRRRSPWATSASGGCARPASAATAPTKRTGAAR